MIQSIPSERCQEVSSPNSDEHPRPQSPSREWPQAIENCHLRARRPTPLGLRSAKGLERLAAFQQAQSGLSTSLGRLLAVAENYPDLKANQNFLDLQAQLEGTENRINVSRKRFNEAVLDFNTSIVGFPRALVASIGGWKEKGYFKADAGAEKAPEVKF